MSDSRWIKWFAITTAVLTASLVFLTIVLARYASRLDVLTDALISSQRASQPSSPTPEQSPTPTPTAAPIPRAIPIATAGSSWMAVSPTWTLSPRAGPVYRTAGGRATRWSSTPWDSTTRPGWIRLASLIATRCIWWSATSGRIWVT